MKQRLQGMILGLLIGVMLAGGTVFAGSISKTVNIAYNNIKIFIDGAEYVAKDGNGKVVEPFVYNGTTYLPVKAIANAFGKDVIWDGKTSSIYIGKKGQNQPDNYLDRMQYTFYENKFDDSNFYKIKGKITDFMGTDYTSGILLYRGYSGGFDVKIDYPLNSQYRILKGKVVLPKDIHIAGLDKDDALGSNAKISKVEVYGDDALLQTLHSVSPTNVMNIEADIQGVNNLTIKVFTDKDWSSYYCALTDLALYK